MDREIESYIMVIFEREFVLESAEVAL